MHSISRILAIGLIVTLCVMFPIGALSTFIAILQAFAIVSIVRFLAKNLLGITIE